MESPVRAPVRDGRVDWGALEASLPLDVLPAFHRAFLQRVDPSEDWSGAFLRRVQGKVQAALRRLEREGAAYAEGSHLWVDVAYVPEAFRDRLEEA